MPCTGEWLSWQRGGPGFVILEWNILAGRDPILGLISYGPPVEPYPYLIHTELWYRKEFHAPSGGTFHISVTFGQGENQCAHLEGVVVPPE